MQKTIFKHLPESIVWDTFNTFYNFAVVGLAGKEPENLIRLGVVGLAP